MLAFHTPTVLPSYITYSSTFLPPFIAFSLSLARSSSFSPFLTPFFLLRSLHYWEDYDHHRANAVRCGYVNPQPCKMSSANQKRQRRLSAEAQNDARCFSRHLLAARHPQDGSQRLEAGKLLGMLSSFFLSFLFHSISS